MTQYSKVRSYTFTLRCDNSFCSSSNILVPVEYGNLSSCPSLPTLEDSPTFVSYTTTECTHKQNGGGNVLKREKTNIQVNKSFSLEQDYETFFFLDTKNRVKPYLPWKEKERNRV